MYQALQIVDHAFVFSVTVTLFFGNVLLVWLTDAKIHSVYQNGVLFEMRVLLSCALMCFASSVYFLDSVSFEMCVLFACSCCVFASVAFYPVFACLASLATQNLKQEADQQLVLFEDVWVV